MWARLLHSDTDLPFRNEATVSIPSASGSCCLFKTSIRTRPRTRSTSRTFPNQKGRGIALELPRWIQKLRSKNGLKTYSIVIADDIQEKIKILGGTSVIISKFHARVLAGFQTSYIIDPRPQYKGAIQPTI